MSETRHAFKNFSTDFRGKYRQRRQSEHKRKFTKQKRLCSLLKINFAQTGMLLQNISPAYGKVLNCKKHRQKNRMSFDKTTLFTSKHRYFMKSSARMLRSTNDIFSFLANSKAERSKYMLVTAIAPPTW